MSEELREVSDQELLRLIKERAYTDPAMRTTAKAMGINVDLPDAPPELNSLFSKVKQDLTDGISDFEEEVRTAISQAKPAFVVEIGIDMLDPENPHLFHGNLSDVEGKAGKDKVFLDDEGKMWSDRVSYIHAQGNHVADKVVSRQVSEPELRRAWVDENGVPEVWYDSSAEDKRGEPISDDFLEKIVAENNL